MLKFLILFPVVAFFWFAVLTVLVLLLFPAKNQNVETILLVSIAVVSAVRVTAYYDEDLSRDLAKILPFALLGVFLVDLSYFSLPITIENMQLALTRWRIMACYLVFAMALELVLRITTSLIRSRWPASETG